MNIKDLVSNAAKLQYKELCTALIERFSVKQTVKWDSVLPHEQQQSLFGGEVLRLIADHPTLATQKEIRPVCLMKGELSQLLFFYVQTKDEKLPKSVIERISKKFVGGAAAERYVIWFFGNKTADVFKIVISGKDGKKIRLKTLTLEAGQWFKTYDYMLSEVERKFNTGGLFQQFKEPSGLWKAVWEAFDISIVNKKFYAEIKAIFDALTKEELPKCKGILTNEHERVQFAIRLIGRIIFCWFLKRKGIISADVLSTKAIEAKQNYYRDLLEPLFFDVFNTPLSERRKDIPDLIKNYPFLNGGLFEPQNQDHRGNWALNISNGWFTNFFANTLERYNFTVDENSAASSEIAIDPEMLGRIFENLLAEQNPETGESARKATGSYYTPREIVDYMVEESLIAYLRTSKSSKDDTMLYPLSKGVQPISDESLEEFVHTGALPEGLKPQSKALLEKLDAIKVIDPACGSGAFPISMLQRLAALKQQLSSETPYNIKLKTIENSIYGVDIQPMATELSRLRCWLSLIVDEDPKNIRPLPNLDFKFVTANSLIDLGYDEFQHDIDKGKIGKIFLHDFLENLNALKAVRQKYFESSLNQREKDKLKKEFNTIKDDLFKISLELIKQKLLDAEFANKITGWNPFDDSKAALFFNKSWMFGVENGFDVVIANPPYIQLSKVEGVPEWYKRYLKNRFLTSGGRLNTFIFFMHLGIELLKEMGNLAFIIPNTILTQEYYKSTRELLLRHNHLRSVVQYSALPFENAVVENVTVIVGREMPDKYPVQIYVDNFTERHLSGTKYNTEFLSNPSFSISVNADGIIEKVFAHHEHSLSEFCEINQAIALIGDRSLSLRAANPDKKYYKVLDGRNIARYGIHWNGDYLDYRLNRIHSCKRKDIFESSEKLFFRRVSSSLMFAYDDEQYFALNTLVVVNLKPKAPLQLKYLLAILNSRLMDYVYRGKFKSTKTVFSEIQARTVGQLPIAVTDSSRQTPLISIVDRILTEKRQNVAADTAELEAEIDRRVYDLYSLTPEEIKIIEGNNANR